MRATLIESYKQIVIRYRARQIVARMMQRKRNKSRKR